METTEKRKFGEYELRGEYHRILDPSWAYFPIYISKMEQIKRYLNSLQPNLKILDLGCGEGVLVEEYAKKGYNISGLDWNYQSEYVKKGDVCNIPLPNESVDIVLCLDVLEHLKYDQQEVALKEIKRILKREGKVIFSLPNLAHFSSRLNFLFKGRLKRTADVIKHPGDRSLKDWVSILNRNGFEAIQLKGIGPTYPVLYRLVRKITFYTKNPLWINFLSKLAPSSWCFLNILVCKIKEGIKFS